jgi:hypothetical protein
MTGRSLVTITDRLTKRICRLSIEEIRSNMEKKEDIPVKKLAGLVSKASWPNRSNHEKDKHKMSKIRHFSVGEGSPKFIVSRAGATGLRTVNLS